jgi:hypothetical protein
MNLARHRALKQRLSDQAELQNARHAHLRQIAFPAEDHVGTWTSDIYRGDTIIKSAIDRAHEHAKNDAKTLENPVKATDMAFDMVGFGVEHVTAEVAGGKNWKRLSKG